MAIDIITGFNSASREALDKRSGPYITLQSALDALNTNKRHVGLKVSVVDTPTLDTAGNIIGGNLTEYVFTGGIENIHLVEAITLKSGVDALIDTAVDDLIDGAGPTLDTLGKLATAIGDADFLNDYSTTANINLALADKADKSATYTKSETNALLNDKPSSEAYNNIVQISQFDYNGLAVKDEFTLYVVIP